MKKPQFAERQYEASVHIELACGGPSPFVPTQSIEAYIGIDAAADPIKTHAIWRILSVHIPRRMQLFPGLWPALPSQFHDQIPGRYCSLFMQFKRPNFQDNKRAKYHTRLSGPYYVVGITPHQQKALLQLQNRVGKKATVRYASPAFWSRTDFDLHDNKRQVLANSAFIPPSKIKKHRKWMYVGPSGKVVLNPDPEDMDGDDWKAVIAEMTELAVPQSLREHIRSLAEAFSDKVDKQEVRGENSWLSRIAQYGQFFKQDEAFLIDLSLIARAAEDADSTWVVMLLPDSRWKDKLNDDLFQMRYWPHYWW